MRRLWEQYGGGLELKISSAGLAPVEDKASPYARELLAREGISLESHIPRRLNESLIENARLVLVMEEHHRQAVLERFPAAKGKVHLLKEFAGITDEPLGIQDPYGGSREIYCRTLEEIREAVKKIIDKLSNRGTFR